MYTYSMCADWQAPTINIDYRKNNDGKLGMLTSDDFYIFFWNIKDVFFLALGMFQQHTNLHK